MASVLLIVSTMRPIFAFLLFPAAALAQWLSAGVTGGVPISPQSSQLGTGYFVNGAPGPNDLILKPYVFGGTVQVKLLWELSAVADFQYERIHQDFTYSNVRAGQTNVGTRGGLPRTSGFFRCCSDTISIAAACRLSSTSELPSAGLGHSMAKASSWISITNRIPYPFIRCQAATRRLRWPRAQVSGRARLYSIWRPRSYSCAGLPATSCRSKIRQC